MPLNPPYKTALRRYSQRRFLFFAADTFMQKFEKTFAFIGMTL
jgi:hypothetical protein